MAGPAEAIDRYKEIPREQIDLRTLDIGMTESFAVELPTGFVNTQNIQSVLVQLNSEGMVSKNFNVSTISDQQCAAQLSGDRNHPGDSECQGGGSAVDCRESGSGRHRGNGRSRRKARASLRDRLKAAGKISIPKKGLVWASGSYKAIISIAEQNG